jgi:hypothetical protein
LRGVLYLLSELQRWEADGQLASDQARALREKYEQRLKHLRSRLASENSGAKSHAPPLQTSGAQTGATGATATTPNTGLHAGYTPATRHPIATNATQQKLPTRPAQPRRALLETLTDPRTIRLLLYSGAAMLVVGIVIWLRDVLYLKLQEPVVQAALLAAATIVATASGWYTILRTRQRLTGRALTLTGSLLVPINFWFLVRSGLVADRGRAWMVCLFCALLYASTAILLAERLYIYLASIAATASAWSLIFRTEREAYGLYALALMLFSLAHLHLARIFLSAQGEADAAREREPVETEAAQNKKRVDLGKSRWSHELLATPLARLSLIYSALGALFYLTLRLWPHPTLYDGLFRLRASTYDASVAALLFTSWAYVLWYAGRYIYTRRRGTLYTLGALALFSVVWIIADGLQFFSQSQILILASVAFIFAALARLMRDESSARALYRAGLITGLLLAPASLGVLFNAQALTYLHSASFLVLASAFALLSVPRFNARVSQWALAYAAPFFASGAFLVALASASVKSQTLYMTAGALWPFVLYAVSQLTHRRRRETQLAAPFMHTADAEFALLLIWASTLAALLHGSTATSLVIWRPSLFIVLAATLLYGVLRGVLERSRYGAGLACVAALIVAAALLDTLKAYGFWPQGWPVAAGVVGAAFLIQRVSARLLRRMDESPVGELKPVRAPSLHSAINFVLDCAVAFCALLWLTDALISIEAGGFGAAFVLLLALVYWTERAARLRVSWFVYIAALHAGAFLLTLLVAFRVDSKWFALFCALALFPSFLGLKIYARERHADWLSAPLTHASVATLILAFMTAMLQASTHTRVADKELLAPTLTVTATALLSFVASTFSTGKARVRYFRAGLTASVVAFVLACLRAGYDPLADVEVYTSPIAALLLATAYFSLRRNWDEYDTDTSLLLWVGSLLLSAPLLLRALEVRLLLDVPAPWRDVTTLCAALALLLFGVVVRLRAPLLVGAFTLVAELCVLALTSVDWLQVPLKYYLITVGTLLLVIFGLLEYRREQFLLMRQRFSERRRQLSEEFGEWR